MSLGNGIKEKILLKKLSKQKLKILFQNFIIFILKLIKMIQKDMILWLLIQSLKEISQADFLIHAILIVEQ